MISFDFGKKNITEGIFIVVDFETVTPQGRPPEPMELAALTIDQNLKIQRNKVFNALMKLPEGVFLTYFDTNQTGILQSDIDKALNQNKVFEMFDAYLPNTDFIFIAQNANYEASIFSRFGAMGNKYFNATFVDTIKIAKYLIPNLKDYKLDTLSKYFNISIPIDRHRALPDVEITTAVFIKLIEKGISERKFTKIGDLLKVASIPSKQDTSQQSLF